MCKIRKECHICISPLNLEGSTVVCQNITRRLKGGNGYKAPYILIYTTCKIWIPEQTCPAKDISLQTSRIKQTIIKAQLLKWNRVWGHNLFHATTDSPRIPECYPADPEKACLLILLRASSIQFVSPIPNSLKSTLILGYVYMWHRTLNKNRCDVSSSGS